MGHTRGKQGGSRGDARGKPTDKQKRAQGKHADTKGIQRRRAQSPMLCLKPPHRKSPQRPKGHYWVTRTWRCVPGNQICSGRGGGAGCQSKARSTIWCIWWNHQRAVKGGEERLMRSDWVTWEAPRLSSNCVSVIFGLSVFVPSVGVWIGQIRSNPYKYGKGRFAGPDGWETGDQARTPCQWRGREFRIIPNIDNGRTRATLAVRCAERCKATLTAS
jgi:hypothetical protein